MLLACGSCGVRYCVRDGDAHFLCDLCQRAGRAPVIRAIEALEPKRRALVVAWEKRARERDNEKNVDRQLILWGVPALAVVGLIAIAAGAGILLVFALVFGVYFWALRKLAAALRGDYAPVATCALLAALMMTMQAVALLLLGRDGGTGALLAALSGGIFVFGVLARYRLCLSMKSALILTVGTAIETVVITAIFAAALQSMSDGYRWL